MAGRTRVALDAMGGDHAPAVAVDGAVAAARGFPDIEVILVGDASRLESELRRHVGAPSLRIVPAADVVARNAVSSSPMKATSSGVI